MWAPAKNDRGKKLGPMWGSPATLWAAHMGPSYYWTPLPSNYWAAHVGPSYYWTPLPSNYWAAQQLLGCPYGSQQLLNPTA